MVTIKQVLDQKGHNFWSVGPEEPVIHALEVMAEKDIGALPVMEGKAVLGMFSERDYARKIVQFGHSSRDFTVREMMTEDVHFITPDKTLEDAMRLMTERKVRHLPVIEGDRIIGILSMRDVVDRLIYEQNLIIQDLEGYITGASYT